MKCDMLKLQWDVRDYNTDTRYGKKGGSGRFIMYGRWKKTRSTRLTLMEGQQPKSLAG